MNKRILSFLALLLTAVLLTACNPEKPPVVSEDGTFSLVNVAIPADRFMIPTPHGEAVYMDKYLPVAIWDINGENMKENMRLTFCDMESGTMLDKEYPLTGTDVPQGVMTIDGVFYLIAPTEVSYRGWSLTGTPDALSLSEVDGGLIEQMLARYETQHITSADGTLSACHKMTDNWGSGGIWLTDGTGVGKFIRENVIMTDAATDLTIQDIRAYSPAAFWGNDTLVYTIGGLEWAIGYGFYDITSGEVREVENGNGILAVTDDCLYTYTVMDYSILEVQKVLKDGTETVIASADTAAEAFVPFFSENVVGMEHTGDACIIWYYEDMLDTGSLCLRVYDGELTKVLLDADMSDTYAPLSDWIHFDGKILLFQPET